MKILFQQVSKHFVGSLIGFGPSFFLADGGVQSQLSVHIFMYDGVAVTVSPALQIDHYVTVATASGRQIFHDAGQ